MWTQKHLLWVWNQPQNESDQALDGRIFAFISTIGRFAGLLRETYKAIDKIYFKTQLSKKYHAQLDSKAKDAIKELKKYHSKKNLIREIRNKLAFHSDFNLFGSYLSDISDDSVYQFYSGEHAGNNFFKFAHDANAACMLDLTGATDVDKAMTILRKEVVGVVADWTFEFLTSFLILILQNTSRIREDVDFEAPLDDKIVLPFFTEPPKETNLSL